MKTASEIRSKIRYSGTTATEAAINAGEISTAAPRIQAAEILKIAREIAAAMNFYRTGLMQLVAENQNIEASDWTPDEIRAAIEENRPKVRNTISSLRYTAAKWDGFSELLERMHMYVAFTTARHCFEGNTENQDTLIHRITLIDGSNGKELGSETFLIDALNKYPVCGATQVSLFF